MPLRLTPLVERRLLVGTVPGNGVINFQLTIPSLGPSTASRALFLQALYTDTQGQRFLSGARSMTILP